MVWNSSLFLLCTQKKKKKKWETKENKTLTWGRRKPLHKSFTWSLCYLGSVQVKGFGLGKSGFVGLVPAWVRGFIVGFVGLLLRVCVFDLSGCSWFLFWSLALCGFCFDLLFMFVFLLFFLLFVKTRGIFFFFFQRENKKRPEEEEETYVFWFLDFLLWNSILIDSSSTWILIEIESLILELLRWT